MPALEDKNSVLGRLERAADNGVQKLSGPGSIPPLLGDIVTDVQNAGFRLRVSWREEIVRTTRPSSMRSVGLRRSGIHPPPPSVRAKPKRSSSFTAGIVLKVYR